MPATLPQQAIDANQAAVDQAQAMSDERDISVLADPAHFTVKHPLYSPWTLHFDSASKQDKAKAWDDAIVPVASFADVESFWSLWHNCVPPSALGNNANYYLFKQGIKPAWEDPANADGGKWSVQLPRGKYTEHIDRFWLYTMLAAIGETFETPYVSSAPTSPPPASDDSPAAPPASASAATPTPAPLTSTSPAPLPSSFSNEITGVIVSTRKAFFRLNIWTRSSNPSPEVEQRIQNIGRHFKYDVLGFPEGKGGLGIAQGDKVSSDVEFQSHKDSQHKYGSKGGSGTNKWTV